ncbi:MAG: alanine--tRNA ligase [Clostridiales bacterium]|nr:alanine--tRNA ligase [Clostridiales bacterium]
MEKYGLNHLREMFMDFYAGKEHYKRKSFSLIPENDKSLLIINSGMAPLKPYFAGVEAPPAKRMVTCQKCVRTGDIENVGHTARHATFFEMMGSFSFGDYFKEESLVWGWEFVTQVLKMPEDKLWASIYEEDDEAFEIWKNMVGIPEERIVRLGKEDNFWEIGTGPCGPCSEVYFDRGEKYSCGSPDCRPGCECDRYVEFWNHVFTQFNRDEAGNYTKLANPNIDTGMGLERIACIMQGVDSIFEVDTIKYILDEAVRIAGVKYKNSMAKTDVSLRIITDHIRSVVFMIGDGIIPSNEGRGYVLRRLLRRAARHGRLLGIEENFLNELAEKVINASAGAYPELEDRQVYINKIIAVEEEKFSATLDQGDAIIAEYVEELKKTGETVLEGGKVFKLYDTFGFPLELTQEILEENGCCADIEGFNENMQRQKETARAARKTHLDEGWAENAMDHMFAGSTEFIGYDKTAGTATVIGIVGEGNKPLDEISEGDTALIVLDKTPFYAESGGQASDRGMMQSGNCSIEVAEANKLRGIVMHKSRVGKGILRVGDEVVCIVSAPNRNHTAKNHTATHLLHKALRMIVGDHVQQAGSSVTAGGLRFDFNHYAAVPKEGLVEIERIVNDEINSFSPVDTAEMPLKDAVESGAMSLFGEKYAGTVRVVSIGDFSKELCGGTHVSNTGQIGAFKITSESGVAAGVRRIEAITGMEILKQLNEKEELVKAASEKMKVLPALFLQRVSAVCDESRALRKELEEAKRQTAGDLASELISGATAVNGVKLIRKSFKGYGIGDLRSLSDDIKAKCCGAVLVLASENDGKATFLAAVTDDLLEKGYHAGNIVKQVAAAAGGSGGGKADMAQAGAKDPSKIGEALAVAEGLI